MPCSPLALAKRALVKVLLALASTYSVAVKVNRDSADKEVLSAFRRVALKVHPDKGGSKEDFQRLQAAKENWDNVKKEAAPRGRQQHLATGLGKDTPWGPWRPLDSLGVLLDSLGSDSEAWRLGGPGGLESPLEIGLKASGRRRIALGQ